MQTVSLFDFEAEETVATRADSVTARTSHTTFNESSFENGQCFLKVAADDLSQSGDHFSIRAHFRALEQ